MTISNFIESRLARFSSSSPSLSTYRKRLFFIQSIDFIFSSSSYRTDSYEALYIYMGDNFQIKLKNALITRSFRVKRVFLRITFLLIQKCKSM